MTGARIGYHASHEQHPPSRLLANLRAAHSAGFEVGMCSDHLAPFSLAQGHSGFAWSWLGAALESTTMSFGTVTAPCWRYHPVVAAQAAATLAEMYPGRFWWALGSGQAVNEHVTGAGWPPKKQRQARLREAVDVIRALFRGETVDHDGMIRVVQARLYVRPTEHPPLIGAAVSAETAAWVASWADGLITVARPHDELRRVVDAFRAGGGEGKPMYLQVPLSWARDEATAERIAFDQWRTNVAPGGGLVPELATPELFDAAASFVRPEDVRAALRVSADLGRHAAWLAEDIELGFERIYLHHVGIEQQAFIDAFTRSVLPRLR